MNIPKSKGELLPLVGQLLPRTTLLVLFQISKPFRCWFPQYKKSVLHDLVDLQAEFQHVSSRSMANRYQKAPMICNAINDVGNSLFRSMCGTTNTFDGHKSHLNEGSPSPAPFMKGHNQFGEGSP